jgi:nucleotide-binding universal stress UspA family protein
MPIRRLVLACDLEPGSRATIFAALEFAVRLEAELHLLHVVSKAARNADSERTSAERALAAVAETAWSLGCEVSAHVVESADVVEAIVKEAAALEADLVVMGSRGRGSHAQDPFGSPAEQVVRRGACPVVIVRTGESGAEGTAGRADSGGC